MTTITEPIRSEIHVPEPYSRVRLAAGILGRAWLWFLAACVAVTLIPILFGWHSYVIVTGSMEPGISAGDVVLASPDPVIEDTVGKVITFDNPGREGHILTHRVVSIDDDGSLVTQGDANPTPDSVHVPRESVTGLGRLLVQFVGLPVVWFLTGDWLPILIHLVILVGAVVATVLDYEPDNHGRRPWQRRIDQHQPADPKRLLTRSAPSITPILILAIAATLASAVKGSRPALPPSLAPPPTPATAGRSPTGATPPRSTTSARICIGNWMRPARRPPLPTPRATTAPGPTPPVALPPTSPASPMAGWSPTPRIGRSNSLTTNSCINTTSTTDIAAPQTFTIIAWFRTPNGIRDWWQDARVRTASNRRLRPDRRRL